MQAKVAGNEVSEAPDLGYWFDFPGSLVYPCEYHYYVKLCASPTQRHYDPESVQCRVARTRGFSESLLIHHPWRQTSAYQICPGEIRLNDRKNRKVEAFSFGANLTIESQDRTTLCAFASPVPIFVRLEADPFEALFIAEVEVSLASAHARWNVNHRGIDFGERLCAIPPLALYATCMIEIEHRLRHIYPFGNGQEQGVLKFIERERSWLRAAGMWPESPKTLEEVLEIPQHQI